MADTQTRRIREYLESGRTLTSKDAWEKWGVTRLSAIIHNLRRQGLSIMTTDEEAYNRYGEKVRYGRYSLCPDADLEEADNAAD